MTGKTCLSNFRHTFLKSSFLSPPSPQLDLCCFCCFFFFLPFFLFFLFSFFVCLLCYCFPLSDQRLLYLNLCWSLSFLWSYIFSDSNNVFTTLVIFLWLLLFSSGDTDKLILICFPLALIIALRNLLRGSGHLFDPFLNLYNYFRFWSTIGEFTTFSLIGSSTSSSFWMRSRENPLL